METTGHSFHVGRWQVTYRATSTAIAGDISEQLDKIISTDLAAACADRLTHGVAENDSSVWLIRELSLDLTLSSEPAHVSDSAQRWAEHLANRIRKRMRSGEEDDSILYFPTWDAYTAQFARDLAAGHARGKWYYEEFRSLFALSTSRAIFEAITKRSERIGGSIVSLLAIRGLRDVLSVMTETDAREIFEAWRRSLSPPKEGGESRWVGSLLDVWNETPLRDSSNHASRDALWWAALAMVRHAGSAADESLLGTVQSLLDLRTVLYGLDFAGREDLIRLLSDDDIAGAWALSAQHGVRDASGALAFFHRNMGGDTDWARRVQGVLLGENEYVRKSVRPKIIAWGPDIPSPYAGVFRLGLSLIASGFEDAIGALQPERAAAWRHLIAIKCVGHGNIQRAFSDSALRLFSGFEGASFEGSFALPVELSSPPQDVRQDARSISDDAAWYSAAGVLEGIPDEVNLLGSLWARAVLRHFARRLIGFESSSPRHLYANFLSGVGYVRDAGDRIIVQLPRPALAVVLSLAGILEESYTLPWLERRDVCLQSLPD